jgi:hypothetical protein
MAVITKIVKNNKATADVWGGVTLGPSESYTLSTTQYSEWASNPKVLADIQSGDLIVNDGTSDLNSSEALEYINLFQSNKSEDIKFDNSVAQLDGSPDNVQTAIEAVKGFRVQSLPFQLIGTLNFNNYLYAFKDAGGDRSGDTSNGYEFSNSAPLTSLYSGTVVSAAASIKGLAVSTGNIASSVELKFELWRVGFNGEGTKLGDIIFNIDSSTYTIGQFWNSSVDTDFAENQTQNVSVSAGDLLGLKFIRQQSSSTVVEIKNATIVLEVEGSA